MKVHLQTAALIQAKITALRENKQLEQFYTGPQLLKLQLDPQARTEEITELEQDQEHLTTRDHW